MSKDLLNANGAPSLPRRTYIAKRRIFGIYHRSYNYIPVLLQVARTHEHSRLRKWSLAPWHLATTPSNSELIGYLRNSGARARRSFETGDMEAQPNASLFVTRRPMESWMTPPWLASAAQQMAPPNCPA